jgi:hypothetical protein
MISALRFGEDLCIGVDHPGYPYITQITVQTKNALVQDFDKEIA